MVSTEKIRIDTLLVKQGFAPSRQRAKALIMSGRVLVDKAVVDKAGALVRSDVAVNLKGDDIPYVSRGGLKLEHALTELFMDVNGLTCLDIGASTGGFTDCLLQHGAKRVYAVDVGYGQLAWSLRQDDRVIVIERTNIRHMPFEVLNETVDLIVVDTSFISLKIVVPASEQFMTTGTGILALIKPQFEAGKNRIGKGGVVRDPQVRHEIVTDMESFFKNRGYDIGAVIPSPITGQKGNQEFIISLRYKKDTGKQ